MWTSSTSENKPLAVYCLCYKFHAFRKSAQFFDTLSAALGRLPAFLVDVNVQ